MWEIEKVDFKVIDLETGIEETVFAKTANSYLITRSKMNEKGINCDHWFVVKDFLKKFKVIT